MDNRRYARLRAGLVKMTGDEALELLNRLSTNDLSKLREGAVLETLLTSDKGRLIDWLRVCRDSGTLWLVCSPGRAVRVADWIERYTIMEDSTAQVVSNDYELVRFFDIPGLDAEYPSSRFKLGKSGLFLRGPDAFGSALDILRMDDLAELELQDTSRLLSDEEYELERLQAGLPSAEFEFKDEINPLELRLAPRAISFAKGCYVGQEVISRMDSYDKVARTLIGWTANGTVTVSDASRIVVGGRPVGRPSSFVSHGAKTVGLAIVKREFGGPRLAALRDGADELPIALDDRPFWTTLEQV